MNKTTFISGLFASAVVGILGGTVGAIVASKPVLAGTHISPSYPSEPHIIKPSTPILLFQNGDAHASVKVDRHGLIVLNFTTKTIRNQIAFGVLGDSLLQLGVFDSSDKVRGGLEVPMHDAAQIQSLQPNSPRHLPVRRQI